MKVESKIILEKVITKGVCMRMYGTVDQDSIIVEVKNPVIDESVLKIVKMKPFTLVTKNDIYESASVSADINCTVNVSCTPSENTSIVREINYEYCIESFEDYSVSEIQLIPYDVYESLLYEDELYRICTTKDCTWHCLFLSPRIYSIRELTDLNALVKLKETINTLLSAHGISIDDVCMYFSYAGKQSHLKMIIANVSVGIHTLKSASKFIYLDDFIKNMKIDPEYCLKRINYVKEVEKFFDVGSVNAISTNETRSSE